MNPSRAIRILAAFGIGLAGPVSSDTLAFARAIDIGSRKALLLFAQENPQSVHAEKAVRLSNNISALSDEKTSLLPNSRDIWIEKNQGQLLKVAARDGNDGHSGGHDKQSISSSTSKTKQKQKVAIEQQAVAQINTSLNQFSHEANRCRGKSFSVTQDCVAKALEKFSRGLGSVTRTPGSVTPVAIPALKEAAKRIRAAKNKREARAAIAAAVPEIKKSIKLVMAGDEDMVYRLQTRQRSLVIKSLKIADQVLVQATGI